MILFKKKNVPNKKITVGKIEIGFVVSNWDVDLISFKKLRCTRSRWFKNDNDIILLFIMLLEIFDLCFKKKTIAKTLNGKLISMEIIHFENFEGRTFANL